MTTCDNHEWHYNEYPNLRRKICRHCGISYIKHLEDALSAAQQTIAQQQAEVKRLPILEQALTEANTKYKKAVFESQDNLDRATAAEAANARLTAENERLKVNPGFCEYCKPAQENARLTERVGVLEGALRNLPPREAIEAAIELTEHKYFGDYEMSDRERDAVILLVDVAKVIAVLGSNVGAGGGE